MNKLFKLIRQLWIKAQLTAPPLLQRTIINLLQQIKRILRLFSKPYLLLYQWHGHYQGSPLNVIFGSWGDSKRFLKSILFSKKPVEKKFGRVPVWRVKELSELPGDLVIIEADKRLLRPLSSQQAFIMPPLVHFILDVRGDWRDVKHRISHNVHRHEFRLMRKYGYEFEISHSDQDFEKFFHEMYLPTTLKRHKELANPESFLDARLYFRHGLLFQIKRNGDWVSGGVCHLQRYMVNFRLMGVKDADIQLIHQGALSAVYIAVIQWANQRGFETVNFRACRSFITGLFQYKRKWGTSIILPPHQYKQIRIKVQRLTPAVRRFFQENPCLVFDSKEKLYALVVTEDATNITPEIKEELQKQYMTQGLSGIQIRSITELVS
jgi:hypothetical protein